MAESQHRERDAFADTAELMLSNDQKTLLSVASALGDVSDVMSPNRFLNALERMDAKAVASLGRNAELMAEFRELRFPYIDLFAAAIESIGRGEIVPSTVANARKKIRALKFPGQVGPIDEAVMPENTVLL